jgi:hypothetical protein
MKVKVEKYVVDGIVFYAQATGVFPGGVNPEGVCPADAGICKGDGFKAPGQMVCPACFKHYFGAEPRNIRWLERKAQQVKAQYVLGDAYASAKTLAEDFFAGTDSESAEVLQSVKDGGHKALKVFVRQVLTLPAYMPEALGCTEKEALAVLMTVFTTAKFWAEKGKEIQQRKVAQRKEHEDFFASLKTFVNQVPVGEFINIPKICDQAYAVFKPAMSRGMEPGQFDRVMGAACKQVIEERRPQVEAMKAEEAAQKTEEQAKVFQASLARMSGEKGNVQKADKPKGFVSGVPGAGPNATRRTVKTARDNAKPKSRKAANGR